MNPSVTAIVVARAGSLRLPGKAMLPFAGSTLIGHKVQTLRACGSVTRVIVGTDGYEIGKAAMAAGAEVMVRDDYHCDEARCTANEMIRDMAEKVRGDLDTLILWAHPTNPLIRPETYEQAIATYLEATKKPSPWDSLLSVTRVQRHCWAYPGTPMNYNPWMAVHQSAADLWPMFFQDGAIFIQPLRAMLANSYFFGKRPVLFEVPAWEGVDIDTQDDYEAAVALRMRGITSVTVKANASHDSLSGPIIVGHFGPAARGDNDSGQPRRVEVWE